jgi:hypothetical protein
MRGAANLKHGEMQSSEAMMSWRMTLCARHKAQRDGVQSKGETWAAWFMAPAPRSPRKP